MSMVSKLISKVSIEEDLTTRISWRQKAMWRTEQKVQVSTTPEGRLLMVGNYFESRSILEKQDEE